MDPQKSMALGIVLERRSSSSPWIEAIWRPVAVIPGAPSCDPKGEWRILLEAEGLAQYHAGTLPLELFRGETEAYKVALSQDPPRLFVVLRGGDASGHELVPFLVTASPYEAQEYLDSSEEVVEPVVMPPAVIALVQAFVERHHVEQPFTKRKRKRYDPGKAAFGRRGPAGPEKEGDG